MAVVLALAACRGAAVALYAVSCLPSRSFRPCPVSQTRASKNTNVYENLSLAWLMGRRTTMYFAFWSAAMRYAVATLRTRSMDPDGARNNM